MLYTKFIFRFKPVLRKLGQAFFFIHFLLFCKATSTEFIKNLKVPHHSLKIKISNHQPRTFLYVNQVGETEKKELSFVLDTGSNISLIRKNIFSNISFPKKFRLKSISGEEDIDYSELLLNLYDENEILIFNNSYFRAIDLSPKFNFDGLIGNDILEKFDVFLELPENAYLLSISQEKINLDGFKKIPFEFLDEHIILKASISEIKLRLLLDTGAGISYLNNKKAKDLNLKVEGKASFIDLSGELRESIYHLGKNLCVAENVCQENIELLSGNSIENFLSAEEKVDGILGLNWIENYSILIDYKNTSLYIKQR